MTAILVRVLAWASIVAGTAGLTVVAADMLVRLAPGRFAHLSARSFAVGVVTGIVAMIAAEVLRPARRSRSQTVQTWRIR